MMFQLRFTKITNQFLFLQDVRFLQITFLVSYTSAFLIQQYLDHELFLNYLKYNIHFFRISLLNQHRKFPIIRIGIGVHEQRDKKCSQYTDDQKSILSKGISFRPLKPGGQGASHQISQIKQQNHGHWGEEVLGPL